MRPQSQLVQKEKQMRVARRTNPARIGRHAKAGYNGRSGFDENLCGPFFDISF
jgi:hypothetical protein